MISFLYDHFQGHGEINSIPYHVVRYTGVLIRDPSIAQGNIIDTWIRNNNPVRLEWCPLKFYVVDLFAD